MQQHRRDTIAFMPQSIEALRFADELDLDTLSLLAKEEALDGAGFEEHYEDLESLRLLTFG